jgi:hypothetical protein
MMHWKTPLTKNEKKKNKNDEVIGEDSDVSSASEV